MSDHPKEEQLDEKIDSKVKIWMKKASKKISSSCRRIVNQIGVISLRNFRKPSTLFWVLFFPIIITLLFGAVFGRANNQTLNLYVADLDQSDESEYFLGYLENFTSLKINMVDEKIISPEKWLEENNKFVLLVIPNTWGVLVSLNSSANMSIYYDPASYSAEVIIEIVEDSIIDFNFDLLPIELRYGVEIDTRYAEGLEYIDFYIPGIIVVTIATIAILSTIDYDLEELQNGIGFRLLMTPSRKFEWILSKTLWQIIMAFVATTLIISFALIYNFSALNLGSFSILFILFATLAYTGIAMILIRLIPNPNGVIFTSILVLLPQVILSGALIPLTEFPQFLRVFSRVNPLYYFTECMRSLMLNNFNQQFWIYFVIIANVSIIFYILGVVITKWGKK